MAVSDLLLIIFVNAAFSLPVAVVLQLCQVPVFQFLI